MKKIYYILILIIILTGCQSKVNMDELAEDNRYHYKNQDFKFSLNLPAEFIYYQTQRIAREKYTDIEYYVPTNDTSYSTQVPSYGLAITVRIFNTNQWQEILSTQSNPESYEWLAEEPDLVYTIKFWENEPIDWQDRWSDEIRQNIKNSFKLN